MSRVASGTAQDWMVAVAGSSSAQDSSRVRGERRAKVGMCRTLRALSAWDSLSASRIELRVSVPYSPSPGEIDDLGD
ncbi:hypothetical protein PAL_GLEAN10008959 [Pteropus alecto]|uniref:Uncharacterized protein n=1 Tax=Pteropus alecto TaxID=9402 RepID=L5KJR2_PTEAL|nr:hypothetical protein PAL_GLEAN10008959 [Pteropus alecto]